MIEPKRDKKFHLEFEISGLPKMMNGSHGHWFTKNRERQKWRQATIRAARLLGPCEDPPKLKRAKLTLTRFSTREPDADGLVSSFKAIIDGLVECGILEDDRPSVIGFPEYKWEYARPRYGKVRVKVEEI